MVSSCLGLPNTWQQFAGWSIEQIPIVNIEES